MVFDLNISELKKNLDSIPEQIKFQKKLEHEIEMLSFSMFLGFSNLEL